MGVPGAVRLALETGQPVYTVGAAADSFIRVQRHPTVFVRRDLAERMMASSASSAGLCVREVDLAGTMDRLHGSSMRMRVIHDYDEGRKSYKSVTPRSRDGLTDSVGYLERCAAASDARCAASAAVHACPVATSRPWFSLMLWLVCMILQD